MTGSVDMLKIIPPGVTKYYSMSMQTHLLFVYSLKLPCNTFFDTGCTVSTLIWEYTIRTAAKTEQIIDKCSLFYF